MFEEDGDDLAVDNSLTNNISLENQLRRAAHECNTRSVEDIIFNTSNNRVDVNDADPESGQTALILAADRGCFEIVNTLLSAGANVDKEDGDGITPLQAAVVNEHIEVIKILLEAGADPHKEDLDGDSAYILAQESGSDKMLEMFR